MPQEPMNTHMLAGMKCPQCGSNGAFVIDTHIPVVLFDHGVDYADYEKMNWRNDASCRCNGCGHEATVEDFRKGFRRAVDGCCGDAMRRLLVSPNAARSR